MILLIMHMKVSAEKRKELSQTITSLLSRLRKEKGCGRSDFFHAEEDENTLCLLQEWDSQKHLEKHHQSECFRVLRGAMNLLEEPCGIVFYNSLEPVAIEELDLPNKMR